MKFGNVIEKLRSIYIWLWIGRILRIIIKYLKCKYFEIFCIKFKDIFMVGDMIFFLGRVVNFFIMICDCLD